MRQETQQGGSGLHLLLLSRDGAWTRAVHAAAAEIGVAALDAAHSASDAMSRLVRADHRISHLLVQTGYTDQRLGDLLALAARSRDSRTALVMLGTEGAVPARTAIATEPSGASVSRALFATAASGVPVATLAAEELSEALAGARLHTRYQPIVRLADRGPIGLEVLARLEHPAHGTLGPECFVPQMETAGLGRRLTEAVIDRAFADYRAHLAPHGLFIAINLPLDVLLAPDALAWLDGRRARAGIAATRIIVELTESQPVAGLNAARLAELRRSIAELRRLGYGLAIDDLGPEMPDPFALLDFGFTVLKLDKALVRGAASDGPARRFLVDAVSRGKAAGMTSIAEGVEDAPTWERMQAIGVQAAQGYLVARPLPAAAVPIWLDAWMQQD
ncbi:MAG: EAL domain-containing protein [Acidisphaera sp.]|nr:EAL domain-containing protein [Acidisphaera sp.]